MYPTDILSYLAQLCRRRICNGRNGEISTKKRIGKTTDSSTNGPRERQGRKGDGREKDGSVLHTLNVNLSGADITFPQAASTVAISKFQSPFVYLGCLKNILEILANLEANYHLPLQTARVQKAPRDKMNRRDGHFGSRVMSLSTNEGEVLDTISTQERFLAEFSLLYYICVVFRMLYSTVPGS